MQRIHEGLDTLWTAWGGGGGREFISEKLLVFVGVLFYFFFEGGRVGLTSFGVRA